MDRYVPSFSALLPALTLFAVLSAGSEAYGQTVSHVSFDRIDLSTPDHSRQISSIHQDLRGFMWFGSATGLTRYDGVHARVFRHDAQRPHDSLVHDQVWEIFRDRDGILWIGTADGLSRFDPIHETFSNFREDLDDPKGLRGSVFLSIAQLPDGRMLFGSLEKGLNLFDPKTGEHRSFTHDPEDPTSLPHGRMDAIAVGPDGSVWIGTSSGVARVDLESWTFHNLPPEQEDRPGLIGTPVRDLMFDRAGRLWAGFSSGLAIVDQEMETVSWFGDLGKGPLIRGRVYGLAEDKLGRLWVARYNGDLALLDRNRVFLGSFHRRLGEENSLPSSLLDTLFLDSSGVLWIGTFGRGVAKHVPHPGNMRAFVNHPSEPNSLGPGKVNELLAEGEGELLVGGMAGLRRLDKEGKFEEIPLPFRAGAFVSYEISELASGKGDTFWVGGNRGLIHFHKDGTVLFSERWNAGSTETFGGGLLTDLLWDPGMGLWIATSRGLFLRNPGNGTFRRFLHDASDPSSLSSNDVKDLALAPNGDVWVGTAEGIARFEAATGTFTEFGNGVAQRGAAWRVFDLLPRTDGSVWAATRQGVVFWKPGSKGFQSVSPPLGPGRWAPRFLAEIGDGRLMIGYLEGLKMFDPESLQFEPRILRLESRGDHYLSQHPLVREDGHVLIPSQGGIFVVDPNDFPEPSPIPPVALTDIHLFHKSVGGGGLMEELELEHDANHLSFQFAALDYGTWGPLSFEIRMDGLEEDWRNVGDQAEVTFPNLDPGTYTFHVRLAGTEGMDGATVASKTFRIRQPLWGHVWFKAVVVGLIFFSGLAVQRLRMVRVRRRNYELESMHRRMAVESKRRQTMQENLSITLDSIADGVISIDENLQILALNPVASQLTGWPQADAVGRPIHEVFLVRDLESGEPVKNPRRWLKAEPDRSSAPIRAMLQSAAEKEYLIATSVAAMRRPSGESYGTVLVFRDITDRAALEAQLAQAQKMESLGRLAGGIAHDFNNLLTSIQGYADLVRMEVELRGAAGGRSKEYVDAVLRSSKRGADLVGQLLAFSRRSESATTELDLHEILRQSVEMLQRTLDPAIEIVLEDQASRCVVNANASLLVNVFLNLGINAGDAMQQSGRLRFRSAIREIRLGDRAHGDGLEPGTYLEVCVIDSGAGMNETMRERIFEPFFTTKDLGDGTGLGLPTALSTVRSFDGTILVDTEPGKGTTMSVLLPLVDREVAVDAEPQTMDPTIGKGTILLIEDDEAVMELCESFLTSLGYVVVLAHDGRRGLEIFEERSEFLDMVLVDYLMPQCNGLEVVRRIRSLGFDLPVMMMTGFSLGVSREEILAEGADAILTKPFLPIELAEQVEDLLRGVRTKA